MDHPYRVTLSIGHPIDHPYRVIFSTVHTMGHPYRVTFSIGYTMDHPYRVIFSTVHTMGHPYRVTFSMGHTMDHPYRVTFSMGHTMDYPDLYGRDICYSRVIPTGDTLVTMETARAFYRILTITSDRNVNSTKMRRFYSQRQPTPTGNQTHGLRITNWVPYHRTVPPCVV